MFFVNVGTNLKRCHSQSTHFPARITLLILSML
jgi:hypothetical protein